MIAKIARHHITGLEDFAGFGSGVGVGSGGVVGCAAIGDVSGAVGSGFGASDGAGLLFGSIEKSPFCLCLL